MELCYQKKLLNIQIITLNFTWSKWEKIITIFLNPIGKPKILKYIHLRVRECAWLCCKQLQKTYHIICLPFQTKYFPDIFKNSTKLHKAGDKNCLNNCRAITLKNVINKLIEKCFKNRLFTVSNKHKTLSHYHLRFINTLSTEDTLADIYTFNHVKVGNSFV